MRTLLTFALLCLMPSIACATWPRSICDPRNPASCDPWRQSQPTYAQPRQQQPSCPYAGKWAQHEKDMVELTARIAQLEAHLGEVKDVMGQWNAALAGSKQECLDALNQRQTEISQSIRETEALLSRKLIEFGRNQPAVSGEVSRIDARLSQLEASTANIPKQHGGSELPLWQLLGAAGLSGLVPGAATALYALRAAKMVRKEVQDLRSKKND